MQQRLLSKLNEKIKSKQIPQRDLARVLTCSQGAVSNLLTGKTKLSVEDVFKISEILDEHPATLIEESTRDIPLYVAVGEKFQKIICGDLMNFHVFNLLRTPMREEEVLNRIPNRLIEMAQKSIEDLLKNGVVEYDATQQIRHCLPAAATVHFELDTLYSKRVMDLFLLSRDYMYRISQLNSEELTQWQMFNTDSLFLNYFTEDQVKEQIAAIKDVRALVRQQQQLNRVRKDGKKMVLRKIFLSNLDYEVGVV